MDVNFTNKLLLKFINYILPINFINLYTSSWSMGQSDFIVFAHIVNLIFIKLTMNLRYCKKKLNNNVIL
jgi:hypothetical protein